MNSDDLDTVAILHDPVRRAVYEYVVSQGRDVGRNEAAEAVGVQRTLAAFHLDKLVEAGLLEAGFRRLTDRRGPGSGRPAKVYHRARGEWQVSVPARDYRTLARVLAEAVDLLGGDEQAEQAARRAGRALAGVGEDLGGVLRRRGYEPYEEDGPDGHGLVRLRNCPFHVLAEEHPLLVCSMNLELCRGMLEGLGADAEAARLDPRRGECCVVFSKDNVD
ncbi:putative ArsR family transcriptional regulator [Streptosporangium becharense]|uniref:Putative ArsR family transcriptional regulator n=1 Tax=Streptosporangium becharense TaxID=1816182 RepID=A0A7W9ICC7_9ACTN|nr:transcriptional regulator [Streptosporangium becharense]MBB2913735.1 putative ArsR family transcriptional regulator [Streptosporangium becharense]MBB5817816.1 putative ArsR family transcriptional regulator [Streptosporangium becharense]